MAVDEWPGSVIGSYEKFSVVNLPSSSPASFCQGIGKVRLSLSSREITIWRQTFSNDSVLVSSRYCSAASCPSERRGELRASVPHLEINSDLSLGLGT